MVAPFIVVRLEIRQRFKIQDSRFSRCAEQDGGKRSLFLPCECIIASCLFTCVKDENANADEGIEQRC